MAQDAVGVVIYHRGRTRGTMPPGRRMARWRMKVMATYSCEKCGMSVNISCAKCGKALVDDSLTTEDGSAVQISKCPEGHGKVKSPLCCGVDMSCAA